jgi:hypothetical protein
MSILLPQIPAPSRGRTVRPCRWHAIAARLGKLLAGLASVCVVASCSLPVMPMDQLIPAPVLAAAPTATPTSLPASPTAAAQPTPSLTPVFGEVRATAWPSDPQAPVLLYHHFIPDNARADDTHIHYSEFRSELQSLYDNGYSLIPLDRWLKGDLQQPSGRRPLILTMDDLFFADQVFLQADGTPAPNTGIGILWKFYQAHPDFGFAVALFANLGDKDYANVASGSGYLKGTGWEASLARTIAWCIDHGAIPYNHFFHHPYLDKVTPEKLISEARDNDLRLQALLKLAGRAELFAGIENILALPYGHWPTNLATLKALLAYNSPQAKPVLGIVEVGGIYAGHYLQAVYSPTFDRNHIPRMVGSSMAMGYLTHYRERFPVAHEYRLGELDLNRLRTSEEQRAALEAACKANTCTDGVYALLGGLFRVKGGKVSVLSGAGQS